MNYKIKRGEQEYGPYTLAELQRYVASGNILLTDLCQSEGMPEWVPVQQVIGNIPVPAAAPPPANPVVFQPSPYPLPPNLHWGVAILLTVITCFLFWWIWAFVQAAWARKVEPASKALVLSFGAGAMSIYDIEAARAFAGLLNLAGFAIAIVAGFNLRATIEEHYIVRDPLPGGFALSGVMTFFFSNLYFQYHFTKIREMKERQGIYY
jgi:uncharacterized protein DUF4339